jgi:DNA-binding LytR/AlgR family response regulator
MSSTALLDAPRSAGTAPAPAAVPGLRCLVVDDHPGTLERLARILRTNPSVGSVTAALDARAALRTLRTERFDVVFLEIELTDLDGVELAWALRRTAHGPEIVFVTRCPGRAAEAFDLGALDYLTKPSSPERLAESVRRVLLARPAPIARPRVSAPEPPRVDPQEEVIPVSLAGSTKLIRRSAVHWAQAQGDYVRLYTPEGSYLIRAGMNALADSWRSAGLVRIHRSYLVQLRYVTGVRMDDSGQFVVDVAGHQLPVSRRQAAKLRGWLTGTAANSRPRMSRTAPAVRP